MEWCGAVRCDLVLCGVVVRCGVMWCSVVGWWCGGVVRVVVVNVRCSVELKAWCGVHCFGVVWGGLVWCGMVQGAVMWGAVV